MSPIIISFYARMSRNVSASLIHSCALSNIFFLYRDRFRTMVNVMGDALATGIMAHICRKDFMKEGDGVSFNCGFSP